MRRSPSIRAILVAAAAVATISFAGVSAAQAEPPTSTIQPPDSTPLTTPTPILDGDENTPWG